MVWNEPTEERLHIVPEMMKIDDRRLPLILHTFILLYVQSWHLHHSLEPFILGPIFLQHFIDSLSAPIPQFFGLFCKILEFFSIFFRSVFQGFFFFPCSFNSTCLCIFDRSYQILSTSFRPGLKELSHPCNNRILDFPQCFHCSWYWTIFIIPLDHQKTCLVRSSVWINK